MFGKNKPHKESEIETVIGANTLMQGTISSKGSIRVDGKLHGGVTESSSVIIGNHGEIEGDITAASIIIGGKVIGNIVATALIEILPSAQIQGDIKTAALSIAEGANFEGNCTMTKEKQVIEMEVNKGRR